MRGRLAHVALVSAHAFREIHRTRVLLASALAGLAVCLVTVLATELSYGAARKVSLDLSLGLASIAVKVAALAYGMDLVSREMERRTLQMVLSRSVSRASFLVGRSLGLFGVLAAGALVVSALGLLSFLSFGGEPTPGIALCVGALLVEAAVVMQMGVLLSLVLGRALVVLGVVSAPPFRGRLPARNRCHYARLRPSPRRHLRAGLAGSGCCCYCCCRIGLCPGSTDTYCCRLGSRF